MSSHEEQVSPIFRYWAFISYSSKDKIWAKWLHTKIESYGIPTQLIDHPMPTGDPAPRRLKPLFRDRDELAASADLGEAIEKALRESRYLIVICSKNSAVSKWVNQEIELFRAMGRESFIFAMIVDGEPNSGDHNECYPPMLRKFEPLAADARPEADGKNDAMLKVLAGMLGVGFDMLKQRDTRRRIKRLQTITSLSFIVVVIFAALALYSFYQRNEAIAAKEDALDQKAYAEVALSENIRQLKSNQNQNSLFSQLLRSKQTTLKEALIQSQVTLPEEDSLALAGFYLERGRALAELEEFDAAEPILRKALELLRDIQAEPAGITEYASSRKILFVGPRQFIGGDELAKTLQYLAEVQLARGNYEDAEKLSLEATQLYTSDERDILKASPVAIAQSFFTLGRTFVAKEKFAEGLEAFSKSISIIEESWDQMSQWEDDKAQALGHLGIKCVFAKIATLLHEGNAELAAEAAAKLETLVRSADEHSLLLAGRAYLGLALVNMKNGQAKEAASWFAKAKNAYEGRYDEDQEGYIEFLESYKDFLYEQTDHDAVVELFRWDIASFKDNDQRDETSRFRGLAYLGVSLYLRSRATESATDRSEALANMRLAFALKSADFGTLAEINMVFKIYLELLEAEIQAFAKKGAVEECIGVMQEKLTVLLLQEQPDNKDLFDCFSNLAGLHERNVQVKEQELALRSAIDLGNQIWPSGSTELALVIDNLGTCLRDQLRLDEAEIIQLTALAMFKENVDSEDMNLVISYRNLGVLRAGQKDFGSATRYLAQANELASKSLAGGNPVKLQIQLELAQIHYIEGSLGRSKEVLSALLEDSKNEDSPQVKEFREAANALLEQISAKEEKLPAEPSK
jgi:tetratricopeptide (TPR) repeat protein